MNILSTTDIIVIGPVLWKCVNCNLLMSRQHSIDEHLRTKHRSKPSASHGLCDPANIICHTNGCSCMDKAELQKGVDNDKSQTLKSLSGGQRETVSFVHSSKDILGIECDPEEDEESEKHLQCDEEEMPLALQDIVEKASRAKMLNESEKHGDDFNASFKVNISEVSCKTKDETGVDECSRQENNINLMADTVECKMLRESSCKDDAAKSISVMPIILKNSGTSELTETLGTLKRKHSLNKTEVIEKSQPRVGLAMEVSDDCTVNNDSNVEMLLYKSAHTPTSTSTPEEAGRRTSARSNKGKNSQYREYKMEFS